METQLLTLNPPYNVICSPQGDAALQIATLMVIEKKKKKITCQNYPVVKYGGTMPTGVTWTECDVLDCILVENDKGKVYMAGIAHVVRQLYDCGDGSNDTIITLLSNLRYVLEVNGIDVIAPQPAQEEADGAEVLEIKLEFQEEDGVVHVSSTDKYYVFNSSYVKGQGEENAFDEINSLCLLYEILSGAIKREHGVVFYTDNDDYRAFVDGLNDASIYFLESHLHD